MNRFAALRTMVEGFLVDECIVREPGIPVFDPDDGYDSVASGATVYEGRCRLRPTGGERIVMAGEAQVTLRMFDLTVPWDATGFKVNQLVTITSSNDPHLLDRVYNVRDVQGGSDTAYRRLVVEDTLSVDEGTIEEVGS